MLMAWGTMLIAYGKIIVAWGTMIVAFITMLMAWGTTAAIARHTYAQGSQYENTGIDIKVLQ